jgi:hypothetical protein
MTDWVDLNPAPAWVDELEEAANDEPDETVEVEVVYVDATGRRLFAVVAFDRDMSAVDVAVFEDETGVRVQVDDDVREAIAVKAGALC